MPLQTAYTMTKHAVQSFTECLALEADLTGKPIHVSAAIPGMVKTRIFEPTAPTEGENPAAAHHHIRGALRAFALRALLVPMTMQHWRPICMWPAWRCRRRATRFAIAA